MRLIDRQNGRRYLTLAVFSLLIAGLGSFVFLRFSNAATYAAPEEAENGKVRGGASVISGASTSGGRTVLFGTAPTPPACTKDPTLYSVAGPIEVSTTAPGFNKVIDPPKYYKVNGYTAQQVRDQINACTPITQDAGEFDAITTWWIKFAYNWYTKPNGKCATRDIAVGAHINLLYPQWTSTPQAAEGLDSKWQTFITNMTTHENGHIDIVTQRSQKLLTDLQNFPDTDCANIQQAVNKLGNDSITAVTTASNDYDMQTQHGLNQGTRFP